MATARANRQEQVIRIRMNVATERSFAFFVLIVLTSWGIPTDIPMAVPIQLKTCDTSIVAPSITGWLLSKFFENLHRAFDTNLANPVFHVPVFKLLLPRFGSQVTLVEQFAANAAPVSL